MDVVWDTLRLIDPKCPSASHAAGSWIASRLGIGTTERSWNVGNVLSAMTIPSMRVESIGRPKMVQTLESSEAIFVFADRDLFGVLHFFVHHRWNSIFRL